MGLTSRCGPSVLPLEKVIMSCVPLRSSESGRLDSPDGHFSGAIPGTGSDIQPVVSMRAKYGVTEL